MSLADLKTSLASQIAAVDGIAATNVHKWMRFSPDWDDLYTFFKADNNYINGWIIEVESAPTEHKDNRRNKVKRLWSFTIWGVYSMVDTQATATTFEALVEAVMNETSKFDNITLGGHAHSSEPTDWIENEMATFGDMIVHRAKLRKVVLEIVSPG